MLLRLPMLRRLPSRELLVALLLAWGCLPAQAAEIAASPADYRDKLKQLQPGDELVLAPGIYTAGLPLHNLLGSVDQPIVIRGAGPLPSRFIASARRNTVSIVDSAYLQIRNLMLDGANQPADAVKAEGHARFAHHITLENLTILRHGLGQSFVGISTKCPAWNWVIRGNRILGAGTGMYLGNSDGRAPFVAGLIEHNLIAGSIGYNLQIKHQAPRPDLPGLPTGVSRTVIRHNLLIKGGNSSQGADARPSLLVGHWPLQGPGRDDRYEIYGNFLYQNPVEALFQGEGNLAFHHNLLVNAFGDAVHIQPHNDVPRKVDVFYNTVVARGVGILVRGGWQGEDGVQRVDRNAVFAAEPMAGGLQGINHAGPVQDAPHDLLGPLGQAGQLRLDPLPDRLRLRAPAPGWMAAYPEATQDFEGRAGDGRYFGAYGAPAEQSPFARWRPPEKR